jgi:hypothetical protein
VTPSTTQASPPSPWRCSQAHNNVVLHDPATLCTRHRSQAHDTVDPRHSRVRSAVILPEPVMLSSPRCRRAHDAIEPASSLSPQRQRLPQARKATIFYIFLCHFGPRNPDFDMLHCHNALICYNAFVLLHCFAVLHYHIALICYVAFVLLHCFDMLHIATLLLFCYILIYLNAYYIAQWWKWTKWDECGNMDQHYCAIKISASNNMKQIGHLIKLKSESI